MTIFKEREVKFSKSKIGNFIDQYKKAHKFVPGAGQYHESREAEMDAIRALSMSPKELRILRH